MVQEIQGPCNMDDMVAILRKDAGEYYRVVVFQL